MHHSRFEWTDLLIDSVIEPLRSGRPVHFRPPGWDANARPGAIEVAADASLVIIEGVGVARPGLAEHLDATIWVQSDFVLGHRRNAARVTAGETSADGVAGWMAEEEPFLAAARPWEQADVIVSGCPTSARSGHRGRTRRDRSSRSHGQAGQPASAVTIAGAGVPPAFQITLEELILNRLVPLAGLPNDNVVVHDVVRSRANVVSASMAGRRVTLIDRASSRSRFLPATIPPGLIHGCDINSSGREDVVRRVRRKSLANVAATSLA